MWKKTVCVDLDGVIARYDGWKGIDHFGVPILGAREFLQALQIKYRVVIYTTRCSEEFNKEDKEKLKRRVLKYLKANNLPFDFVFNGQGKPPAIAYIDDRGIMCKPQEDGLAFRNALAALGIQQ